MAAFVLHGIKLFVLFSFCIYIYIFANAFEQKARCSACSYTHTRLSIRVSASVRSYLEVDSAIAYLNEKADALARASVVPTAAASARRQGQRALTIQAHLQSYRAYVT